MGGNSFGTLFKVTCFGESHGPGVGCVVDGCPSGLALSSKEIERELKRRRPGEGKASSGRAEKDEPEILSGIYEGKTLGTPIAVLVRNRNTRPGDYDNLKDIYRPGHADWPWEAKYGFRDHRGGGRASARETIGRVAAGAIGRVFLSTFGIEIYSWTSLAAGIDSPEPTVDSSGVFDRDEIESNPLRMPNRDAAKAALERVESLKVKGDSVGCAITCVARNLPPGLGEPVFDKLDARIAAAMLSLGAAKAVEFGDGFAVSRGLGSELNDCPIPPGRLPEDPRFTALPPGVPPAVYETNHAGGLLGGLSTGADLRFTVTFKPVPSISKPQKTINRQGKKTELTIQGRHDVCVAPRAGPVVEAMCALVLADLILLQRCARV